MLKQKKNKIKKKKIFNSPPQYEPTITYGMKFRYISSAALVNTTIATSTLMRLLVMANTTTTTTSLYPAFKLKRVRMWAASTATAPVTISLEYLSSTGSQAASGSKPKVYCDSSIGQTRNAILDTKPDKESSVAQWQRTNIGGTTSGAGMILNGPLGTVIDLELTLTIQNGETPNAGRATTLLATIGSIYCDYLDNGISGPGTFLLTPQGYNVLPI